MNSLEPRTNSDTTNARLQARRDQAFPRGQGNLSPFFVQRADGAQLWDVEGKRYIDFTAGIAVCNTGHLHPKIKAAAQHQLEQFSHTCMLLTPYESAVELAEKLNDLAPGDTRKKTIFVTTGAEAVENSVKIARAHTGRRGVIAFNGAFHGRTLLAMGLTGKVTPYKNLFGPLPGEIYHAPFPIDYHGVSVSDALRVLDSLFHVEIAPNDVAAIIVEPIQGEGGFYPAPVEFLQSLRRICDDHGIVLIVDEIQTGFGRTGKWFCCEYAGIEPDLMPLAKGLAGGFPLAAVVGKAHIMDAPLPGGLGGTFAGSPIACVAALAVIDVIETESLAQRAIGIGAQFRERLTVLQKKYPDKIGDLRADHGAMLAIELVKNGDANQPDPELTKEIVTQAYKRGLVLLSCGVRNNVVRFLPALTISKELVTEGLEILSDCLDTLIA